MRAIVHLGMPKTGTTAIQSWLQQNKGLLKSQGIGYDRASLRVPIMRPAHIELSAVVAENTDQLLSNKSLRILFQTHDRESQKALVAEYEELFRQKILELETETVVLSSEYLGADLINRPQITALDTWLSRYFDDIQYVIYFRRQEDLILSSYSQRLKSGSTKTFEEFVASAEPQDYASIVRRWTLVVGSKRLNIRLFEPDWLKDGDVIADFANVIGVDSRMMVKPESINESLGIAAQHLLRAINKIVPHTLDQGKRFNPIKSKLRERITRHPKGGQPRKLTNEQTNYIRKLNEDGNTTMRDRFFRERAELFPIKEDVAQQASEGLEDDISLLSAELLAELGKAKKAKGGRNAPQPPESSPAIAKSVGRISRWVRRKFRRP